MPELADTIAGSVADHFQMVRDKVHQLVDPLSADQIWRRPYPYGNSIGNLLLHLTGNLNYYIGAQIAASGYVRHRDLEFSDPGKPKEQLLRSFDQAVNMVVATVRRQSAENWSAAYSAERSKADNRFKIVLDCAAHAYHHVGQIIYLQKQLTLPAAQSAD
jgi:uncharacterized damage-inducible protein DinB